MSDPEDPLTPALREVWLRRRRSMRSAGLGLVIWTILVTVFVILTAYGTIELPTLFRVAFVPLYFLPVLFYGLFGLINQRCPRCAKSQSRVRNPRFCYNCGLRLRE
jgi:hypothetical protein